MLKRSWVGDRGHVSTLPTTIRRDWTQTNCINKQELHSRANAARGAPWFDGGGGGLYMGVLEYKVQLAVFRLLRITITVLVLLKEEI